MPPPRAGSLRRGSSQGSVRRGSSQKMNAIASFDPNAANHRRRSTLSPRRPSLQGRVAPAKRAIHPLLVGKFRACDALLRRMNRFSPLFDGAFGARRRHLRHCGNARSSPRLTRDSECHNEASRPRLTTLGKF